MRKNYGDWPAKSIYRRTFLLAASAALASAQVSRADEPNETSLSQRAEKKGLSFGTQVNSGPLFSLKPYHDAVLRDASMIVPENEMKWRPTQPTERQSNYFNADRIARFAEDNALLLRGHTAVWHQNPPVWTKDIITSDEGQTVVLDHARELIGHFRGRVMEWDVVNEAIAPEDGMPDNLRNWPPYNKGGIDFIADCFHAAREADPKANLYYNDYSVYYQSQGRRRDAILSFLEKLKSRGAPIDGFGIQSHLIANAEFDENVYRRFLSQVADLGLKIRATELDVSDVRLGPDIDLRDAIVAAHTKLYLDVLFDEPAVIGLVTWGMTDRFSWLHEGWPRKDRLTQRCLPLDENFAKKPMWYAIAEAFDRAPSR
ncbi:endo-1,4-beta-xylanase [Rhizobium sp. BK379]|uniref:endo-1,4-beta-xylanase n=1 Tax=Rhizobium sp. BK379 TaxID=2587059 RepID=UPI00161D7424|nr:endo-1,4-beta-xylanase [Rhizobium sp. BK379]MBB3444209.1 endo-1,4-beta-xylanase [Rhizobium sp. BK379]